MPPHGDPRLYLFACLPPSVQEHLDASNDFDEARIDGALGGRSPVAVGRRHVTIANLSAIDAPQDYVAAVVEWIMATIPPFAFRVAFDELVVSPRSALIRASVPLRGVEACRAHLVERLAEHEIALPHWAMQAPHITLGYDYRAAFGRRAIDGLSWMVDELVLVRSHHGLTVHEHLGRWRLPKPEPKSTSAAA